MSLFTNVITYTKYSEIWRGSGNKIAPSTIKEIKIHSLKNLEIQNCYAEYMPALPPNQYIYIHTRLINN